MILSIIIPMYKVEQYIEKCLQSCLAQDIPLSEYEILCVNDGSPDASVMIAEKVARQYNNVRVISQENKGLSVARNTGLEISNGEYIWFVDSDDWIENNCLGRITSKLSNGLDILQLQYRHVWLQPYAKKEFKPVLIEGVKSGLDVTLANGLPVPVPFCIYRRDFLLENKLNFIPGIYHEDSEFKPRAVYLAKKIASDDVVSYNYFQRQSGSIMSSFSQKRAEDILFVNERLYAFSQTVDKRCAKNFYQMIGTNMNSLLYGYRKLKDSEKISVRKVLEKNMQSFKCMIKSHKIKYVLEGLIFNFNLNFGFVIHKLLR